MLSTLFRRIVLSRVWLCFCTMCVGFAAFGLGTLNLLSTLRINLDLIAEHGLMALMDGAAKQLLELVATLAFSMLGYLVFKACEHALVAKLTHYHPKDSQP